MVKTLNILGHKSVLAVAVAALAGTNISIREEVPDLVVWLEAWKLLLQSPLNATALVIPALNILRRNERQCHEPLQLSGEILGC